jgi:hypothetical protein
MKWEEKTCGHTKKKKKAHETTCPCNFPGDFCKD